MVEFSVIILKTPEAWRAWLEKHHNTEQGVWFTFFKKASGKQGITYAQALDEALCYGWIDGQVKKNDEDSWLQKFTPRRIRSMWSHRNTQYVTRLIEEGKMTPAGQAEIDRAKADGRWDVAYSSPKNMEMPEDFMNELSKNKNAYEFFKTLNKTNTYAIAWRLQTAKKPETRERRMKVLLEMLAKGEKLH